MSSPSSIPKSLCNKRVLLTDERDRGASNGHHSMELGKQILDKDRETGRTAQAPPEVPTASKRRCNRIVPLLTANFPSLQIVC
jgi:hypothetical protein